jgi:aspartyl-tRNA(Asn)/glutamyl-tRNA(Gln) amidotransferase subunit A
MLNLTITEALAKLESKEISAVELTQAHIDAMAKHKGLNAFITETPELALKQAAASDARRAAGNVGLLEGIPYANKDLFCTKSVRTTAASKILENFVPDYDSTVGEKLLSHGAVMLGKTSLDQFGMGSANTNSYFGNVINPYGEGLTPGGSSGGSAAAVAAKMAMCATATDTGGSVRQPAAFCGIVGAKPTYGRCSRWGVIAFASSLDQPSFMARSVEDTAIMTQAASGYDAKDSTSAARDVPNMIAAAKSGDVKGLRVGIPKEYTVDGMPSEIKALWEQGAQWLKEAGAEIVEVSLPHTSHALPVYYIIAPAEASSNLARYDGVRYGHRAKDFTNLNDMYEKTRAEGFGDEVKRRILIGTYVLSAGYYDAYYVKAQKVRALIARDFEKAYEQCDVLLTPVTPSAAFKIGENQNDPVKMYMNDVFTNPASLAGLPAMSVPAGKDANGLPLGLQIIGKRWDEETMFKTGRALEMAAGFKGL